jgi:branched-chain amino acid transport system ATP-binding protein
VLRLVIDKLEAGYGAVRVLHGLSLELRQGETVVLLGTNGNGKSTLMKCIMALLKPARGSVALEDRGERIELTGRSPQQIVALGIALVPEGRRLFPKLTVQENLLLGAFRREARQDIHRNLAICYEAFPVLSDRARQLASSLSGGQQQMLAIGRALMSSPDLLVLDEPSEGLAPVIVDELADLCLRLAREGVSILLIEQNFGLVHRVAERYYVLAKGAVVEEGRLEGLTIDSLKRHVAV